MQALHRNPIPGHSEFSVLEYPGYREYRLQNCSAKVGNGLLPGVFLAALLSVCWQNLTRNNAILITVVSTSIFIRSLFSQLTYESVILLPPHGIQLEARYGVTGVCSLGAKRRFIPSHLIEDVIIHEGLSGWNVLYYLAVVKSSNNGDSQVEVAYENSLPPHRLLLEVYAGIHEALFTQPPK